MPSWTWSAANASLCVRRSYSACAAWALREAGTYPNTNAPSRARAPIPTFFGVEMGMSFSLTQAVRAAPTDRRRSRRYPRPRSPAARNETPHCGSVGTGPPAQLLTETLLLSSVTAPFRAKVRAVTFAPVFSVMLDSARIFPANDVVVPRVAELPTCQKTLHTDPLLITTTDEPLAVVSVLPILKMKTAPALPWALSVRVPVS